MINLPLEEYAPYRMLAFFIFQLADINLHNLCYYYAAFADSAGRTISDSHIRRRISGISKAGVPLFGKEEIFQMKTVEDKSKEVANL